MSYYRFPNYNRPSFFGGFQFFPPVIKALIISNVAVYLLTSFFGLFSIGNVSLATIIGTYFPLYPLGAGFQVWQLFTYLFMHGGTMHLLFNMIALWMFGMELENVWGSKKFLLYYLLCGVGAGLSNLLISPLFTTPGPTVGASGAIYGVLLAFGVLFPDRPIFVYFLLPIRAKYFVLFYILWELFNGVTGTSDGVAHFAHLGGAVVGLIYLMAERKGLLSQGLWTRAREQVVHREPVNQYSYQHRDIADAKYSDVNNHDNAVNQEQIDEILDKISQHGYQSLTEEEKKLLFDASKKLN